jgi:phosphoglycerate dehydrogenase-like enzyme
MRELLICAPFCPEHLERIKQAAGAGWDIRILPENAPAGELRQALSTAQVVIGNPTPSRLRKTNSVKWVQITNAGTDPYTEGSIPFPEGMRLTNASGAFGTMMSQYVLGQVLAIMQNLPAYHCNQLEETWKDLGTVSSLEGATVLIFGAGNIGTMTAKRLQGFDTFTIGVCRNTEQERPYFDALCTLEEAEAWLPKADVVIGCIPNHADTRHYLDERRLGLLKEGAVLVNVGRGNFIDCMALNDLLNTGKLKGAALDVTQPEPLPQGHPLWKNPRCVITPHVSGGSFGRTHITEEHICRICCENLRRWNQGEELINLVR